MTKEPDQRQVDRLPPTSQRMLDLMSDGESHIIDSLKSCLADELGEDRNLQHHLNILRRYLSPLGWTVLCEFGGSKERGGKTHYRVVKYGAFAREMPVGNTPHSNGP